MRCQLHVFHIAPNPPLSLNGVILAFGLPGIVNRNVQTVLHHGVLQLSLHTLAHPKNPLEPSDLSLNRPLSLPP